MNPNTIPLGTPDCIAGFVDWGKVPSEEDRQPGKAIFTKNPETGFAYIWSWEYSCWMQFAAVSMDMGSPMDLVERNQALARENADLRRQVEELTRGVTHWKANHDNRVEAARMLIERLDSRADRRMRVASPRRNTVEGQRVSRISECPSPATMGAER